ncbi:MAG: hypothetical protein KTR13_07955 [Saprospiraceae bacterium]|nr:hypothetical protein [Saprospiraceae bacterium]
MKPVIVSILLMFSATIFAQDIKEVKVNHITISQDASNGIEDLEQLLADLKDKSSEIFELTEQVGSKKISYALTIGERPGPFESRTALLAASFPHKLGEKTNTQQTKYHYVTIKNESEDGLEAIEALIQDLKDSNSKLYKLHQKIDSDKMHLVVTIGEEKANS